MKEHLFMKILNVVIIAVFIISCENLTGSPHNTSNETIGESNGSEGVISEVLFPRSNATSVNVDTYFWVTFDSTPVIGSSGIIGIYDADDDSLVDSINLEDKPVTNATEFQKLTLMTAPSTINIIGNTPGRDEVYPNQVRIVNYYPIIIDGKKVKIIPHNNKLKYGKTYYIRIDNGTFNGTIGGKMFTGITNKETWRFSTKQMPTVTGNTIYVSADGKKDFTTLQGALDYIPVNNTTPYTVYVAAGVYEELLFLRNKSNISVIGDDRNSTIIQYDNYDSFNNGTGSGTNADSTTGLSLNQVFARGGRAILLISGGDSINFENLWFKSIHAQGSASANQAETIYFNSNGRFVAKHCSFTGYQDTIQVKGFSWFYDCLISGDVDFIWGANNTALFENCEIRSRYNNNGGYIVQARSIAGYAGFVFLNCKLTRESDLPDASVYLARSYTTSGSNSSYYDNVAFISCMIDSHIKPIGFLLPTTVVDTNPSKSSSVAGWREYGSYNSSGTLNLANRGATNGTTEVTGPVYSDQPASHGTYVLSDEEVKALYTNRSTILSGATYGSFSYSGFSSGWVPIP